MTIFDVVAFKMVTALASSTAAVTAADWSAVVDAMTGQISVSTIVATLAVFVGAVIGIPAFLMLHIRYRKLSISLIRLTLVIPLTKIGSILRGILLRILCVVGFVIMGQMFRSAGLLVLLSVLILRFL